MNAATPQLANPRLPTKIIYCYRSGVPLANVQALCSQGWPLLNSFQATLIHPIYQMGIAKLIVKLNDHLNIAEKLEWMIKDNDIRDIQLCMSAIMYDLGAMWIAQAESKQHVPSLPHWPVAVGSARRLMRLAEWYNFATSKRLEFPQYRVSVYNKNTNWENFSSWLEDAETIRDEWENKSRSMARTAELRKRDAALASVKTESIYKRLDFNKIWNWIDIQLATEYSQGRRETFKELFMKGDLSPEDWLADDVDDLVEAILKCCDIGNEITHFINTRLNHIRALIADFYSSFTLLNSVSSESSTHPDSVQTKQEQEFFAEFDNKLDNITELPPAPKRDSFASVALFLKAQAQHNILKRRFDARKKG
jgi:hypothetical protein